MNPRDLGVPKNLDPRKTGSTGKGASGDEYYVALTGSVSCVVCISVTPF